MRVLFVENDDSFSWNVIDRLPVSRAALSIVSGRELELVRDETFDLVVVGPGPLDPERAGLVNFVRTLVERRQPTLGICLGHQALGLALGARIVRSEPKHGVRERIVFSKSRFFPAFEGEVEVMRYHSLSLADLPSCLRVVAKTKDGLPMAVEHERLPLAGLQFHPDSFATPRGEEMLASFFERAFS